MMRKIKKIKEGKIRRCLSNLDWTIVKTSGNFLFVMDRRCLHKDVVSVGGSFEAEPDNCENMWQFLIRS